MITLRIRTLRSNPEWFCCTDGCILAGVDDLAVFFHYRKVVPAKSCVLVMAVGRFGDQDDRVPSSERVPASTFFVISAVFHYMGPAFAVLLFTQVDVLGVAWLRIASAALVFALWRSPWRTWRASTWPQRRLLLGLGAVLATMNSVFYLAIDVLPLGTVGAIEFVGAVTVAAIGLRTFRNAAALVIAVSGVYLLADVHLVTHPLGMALAVANAALFAGYVTLGHRLAEQGGPEGIDRLATAMVIAMVLITPFGLKNVTALLGTPMLILAGIGVGVCSSVIPYVCDQLAMARLPRPTFAVMLSLLPAIALVIGLMVLGQVPTRIEVAGIAAIMLGLIVHKQPITSTSRRSPPDPGQQSVGPGAGG